MTLTNKVWAVGISLLGTWYGISVMFGHIPGLQSGIGTFERIAALTAMGAAEYGYFITGLGALVFGWISGALCLVGGEGSPDAGLGVD
jgi:hypothetical protein